MTQKPPPRDAPHVIVVPNSLVDQWVDEALRLLRRGGWNIHAYTGSYNRHTRLLFKETWQDAAKRLQIPYSRTILIVSHSVRRHARSQRLRSDDD